VDGTAILFKKACVMSKQKSKVGGSKSFS